MRALLLVLAILMICAASMPASANGQKPRVTPTPPSVEEQPMPEAIAPSIEQPTGAGPTCTAADEQLMQRCLMNMGLTSQQISQFRAQGLCYSDIAIAQAIAVRSNCPISQVIAQFQTSKDWNQVAKAYNINLTDLITGPMIVSSDVETYNLSFVSQYYGIPVTDLSALRQQGYSWDQINVMANAAIRTRQPIQQIASLRSQGMSWNDIASRYNTTVAALTSPMTLRTVYATPAMGAGPSVLAMPVMYDTQGNVILTADQANIYYNKGYDWIDIAIAANMQAYGGIPMDQTLLEVRSGTLWDSIIMKYGVAPEYAYNLTNYPFERKSIYSSSVEQSRLNRIQRYQCTIPCPGPCPTICPPVCPTPVSTTPVCPPVTPAPVCPPVTPAPSGAGPAPVCPPAESNIPSALPPDMSNQSSY